MVRYRKRNVWCRYDKYSLLRWEFTA